MDLDDRFPSCQAFPPLDVLKSRLNQVSLNEA